MHLFGHVLEHCKFLSFVNSTVLHEAHSFGSQTDNGTWTGMMALVTSGVAEFGVGDFTATKDGVSDTVF